MGVSYNRDYMGQFYIRNKRLFYITDYIGLFYFRDYVGLFYITDYKVHTTSEITREYSTSQTT